MSRRDDMVAALERKSVPSMVPIWELEFHAWDSVSGRHLVLGEEMAGLTPGQQEQAMHTNAEIIVSTACDLQYAAVSAPGGYWYVSPGELAYYVLPGDLRFRQVELICRAAGSEIMVLAGSGGVICADYSEAFCERLFFQPEAVEEGAESMLAYGIENAKRLRDAGVGAVLTGSDIADNSGPFFNPEQMRRFIYPFARRWAQAVHEMGLYAVLHSDGQLTPYLDELADTGLDALQAIDATAGMDMAETRRIVGRRLCLCGNIDCGLLLRGQPEQVYAATATLLESQKSSGGFVLGASNAVQKEVPVENYRAMISAWKKHGK